MGKNLIVCYSRRGQNYVNGEIKDLARGNSEICAEFVRNAVGGDLFMIETSKDYPADYYQCTSVAKDEKQKEARPELKRYLDSVGNYDNVFVCGPCWWGTYPMAVFSLLERVDLQGKRVFPLMTHEGSGLGSASRDLAAVCKGAVIGRGLAVKGAEAAGYSDIVGLWAKESAQGRWL
ncbi:MAG: flavodoxin [Succinivibrionaceae bacterium]|nr:flavodoxin [Succinivibrionaceae bacterium]